MKTNFDELLVPIGEEQPAGRNVEYQQIYDDIRQARESDPDYLPQGEWATELRKADWLKVIRLSREVLKKESKDLQVACWFVEGLTQQNGLAGLLEGTQFLAAFLERYWQTAWPELDEDGAVIRHSILNRLDRQLALMLNSYPLLGQPESSLDHWQKVLLQEHQSTMARSRTDSDSDFSMETFNRWALSLVPQKIVTQSETLELLIEMLNHLEATYDEVNPQADSSALGQTRSVIAEMQDFMKRLFDRAAPAYDDIMSLNVLAPQEADLSAESAMFAGRTQKQEMSRDLAISQMLTIAHFFRQTEPSSPVPFLMERAARWAGMTLTEWLDEMLEDKSCMRDINKVLKGQETE
ncbi:type VI secretion system protein ImpA [Buttiauxella sp. JUb87]|uniref:type VI secretion system protein TssA n=1 Tax=Buttiauxella sp. JUb87 TaxID=2485129 RepID=UPI00105B41EE|nr:type VI secretion system protein TssA [Buttiauxella sp. JUb87]TDN54997.1 type VI secretion system protein ImpA [Buttiauxella sp. JUb87]